MNINKMRIGNKIIGSFAIVGVLFAFVVWQFDRSSNSTVFQFDQLLEVTIAKQIHSLNLDRIMLQARRSEKDFLIRKQTKYRDKVSELVNKFHQEVEQLIQNEQRAGNFAGVEHAKDMDANMASYGDAFYALVSSWEHKGLTSSEGLQGDFRNTAHELEAILKNLDVSELVETQLQLRRSEKDFLARGDDKYIKKHVAYMEQFHKQLETSTLNEKLKTTIKSDLRNYNNAFISTLREYKNDRNVTKTTLSNLSEQGRILELLLKTHYVSSVFKDYLLVRRHEKDYLLRGSEKYISKIAKQIAKIQYNLDKSLLSPEDKAAIKNDLNKYLISFNNLVAEDQKIASLTQKMREMVH
ncbi:MAG: hypothetical protein HQL68_11825, partial [Magnetococcales bacterium]|nr:hypothetical protein [Magnetococcales bacterium]